MQSVSALDIQPMLTIAIPTYNRATYLGLCLRRISEELDNLSVDQRKLVKVYVANNASTDNTTEIISRHQSLQVGKVEVVNNTENIGGERNVVQCYTSATTPYVWILGDDDVILSGGLRKVLDVLLMQKPDVLYVGNYWFKENYNEIPVWRENHGVSIFSDALDFAKRTHVMLTFISGLIVRGNINSGSASSSIVGSNLPQLGWVLPLLRDGNSFAIIKDWVVAAKGGNSGGYSLIKVFGEDLQGIASRILKDKPKLAKTIQNGTIVNFFPGFILELRKGSSKFANQNMEAGLKAVFGDNWRYCIFLVPLIKLPLFVAHRYNQLLNVLRRLIGIYFI